MADGNTLARVSLRDEVRAAFTVLGDDEYRRWHESCRALETAHEYPWAEAESRALVASVLGCMFGEDLARLDAPSRKWARTNSTMAVFTRRLGCLRELIGQEGVFNGPDATLRVHQIFDRVTIVGTEAALAALTYSGAPTQTADEEAKEKETEKGKANKEEDTPASQVTTSSASLETTAAPGGLGAQETSAAVETMAPVETTHLDPTTNLEQVVTTDSEGEGAAETGRHRIRRRTVVVMLAAAVVALVTSLAFALSSSPPRHHAPRHSGGTPSAGTSGTATTGPTAHGGAGSGTHTTRGGPGVSTGGPAHGSAPGSSSSGSSSPGGSGSAGGAGSSGNSGNPGGSTGLTLPGGTPVTTPQLTVPGGSTVTTTNVTLPHP